MAQGQNAQLAILLIQILAQYGPETYAAAVEIAHKNDPTRQDFLDLLDSISKETYDGFIAQRKAALAAATPATPPTGA